VASWVRWRPTGVVATRRPGMAGSPAPRTATRALAVGAAGARRWSLGVGALEASMAAACECRFGEGDGRVRAECGRWAVCGCLYARVPISKRHTTVARRVCWWAWAGRVNSGSWAVRISGMGCSGTGWRYPNYPELVRVSQVRTRNYQINFGYPVLRVRVRVFRVRVTGNGFFAQSYLLLPLSQLRKRLINCFLFSPLYGWMV
jgi:hypothetical protein